MKNVRDDIDYDVWHNVRVNVSDTWHNIGRSAQDNTGESVWFDIWDNVWDKVSNNVSNNVRRFTQKEL